MTAAPSQDWTNGPAKWAAVIVLGTASIAGMAWSIFARQPAPITAPRPIPQPLTLNVAPAPAPAAPNTAPQTPPPATTPQLQTQNQPAPTPTTPAAPAPAPPRPAPINLNTATAAQLELLPGIGPIAAARIIDYRTKNGPFKSITALDAVKGIGPKTIESLRPLVTVE